MIRMTTLRDAKVKDGVEESTLLEAFRKFTLEARLLTWLLCVNLYDFFSTKLIVSVVGPSGEANPLMRWVIDHYSIWGILVFKLFALFMFWGAYSLATPVSRLLTTKTITRVLFALCTLLSFVCIWNTYAFYRVWII